MMDFKLNDDGDISLKDGAMYVINTFQDAVKQRLQIVFRTFQGEWWEDITYGMPYRDGIIGKKYSKDEIDALYLSKITSDPDVLAVDSFVSTYNAYTREYDLDFEVRARQGNIRVNTYSLRPDQEIIYPVIDTGITPSCEIEFYEWNSKLHPIIHEDLPAGGQFTWIYP